MTHHSNRKKLSCAIRSTRLLYLVPTRLFQPINHFLKLDIGDLQARSLVGVTNPPLIVTIHVIVWFLLLHYGVKGLSYMDNGRVKRVSR